MTKNKPTIVYIDGENAFFQFYDELRRKRKVRYREDLVKFDLKWLLDQALDEGERIDRYYGVKLQEVDSSKDLLERTQRMIDHKRRWIGYLSNLGIDFIEAGQLKVREVPGRKKDYTFEEKGVDVRLAVDIVEDAVAQKADHIVLMSSDADLLSAVHAARRHDTKVTYLSHEERTNDTIVGGVDETKTFTSKQILEAFKRAN